MALWEVFSGEEVSIEYSDGAYSVSNPKSNMHVKRYYYKVPFTNVGKGGLLRQEGKVFHTPSWIEVHPKTTLEDILVDKKPFDEVFAEPKTLVFESASSDKTYTVKFNKHGKLSCDCWGYIGHKKCKHIKQAAEQWGI